VLLLDLLFREFAVWVLISGSLLIGSLLVLLILFDRECKEYRDFWWGLVAVTATVSLMAFIYVMWESYYSQIPRKRSLGGVIVLFQSFFLLFFFATVVVPSYPALFLLGLFPPKSYNFKKRLKLAAVLVLGSAILVSLILLKHREYMEDFRGNIAQLTIN